MRRQHRRLHLVMVVFMVIGMLSNTLASSAAQDANADLTATTESTTESSSASTPETNPATEPPVTEPAATEPPVVETTEPAAPVATEPVVSVTEETTATQETTVTEEPVVVSTETVDEPTASGEGSGQRMGLLAETDDEPSCDDGHVGVDLGSGRVTSVNATLTNPANWDSRVEFDMTWAVPDTAQKGDYFTFQLPSELAWVNMYIPLEGGVGTATVVAGTVKIVLSDFVCTHNNVRGSLWVDAAWKNAGQQAGEDVTMTVDGNVIVVSVPSRPPTPTPTPVTPTAVPPSPTPGPSPTPKPPTPTPTPKPPTAVPTFGPSPTPTPANPSNPSKTGKFTDPNDQGVANPTNALEWTINTGRPGGATPVDVTVTETVNGGWGWEINCSTVSVNNGGAVQSCSTTSLVVTWTALNPNTSARVTFRANITGQLTGYENTATVSKPGATTTSQFVSRLSGGGGGEGDNVKRPATPVATAGSCLGGEWTAPNVILPSNETGLSYSWVTPLNPETGAYAIKAQLSQGYSWTDSWPAGWVKEGTSATYTSTVAVNPCSSTVPVAPTVEDGACVNGESTNPLVTLAITPGIVYTFTTAPDPITGGDFTVQAKLADGGSWGAMPEGWSQVNSTTATYSGSVQADPCDDVAPVEPTVNQGDCVNGGVVQPSVTLPPNGDGVSYSKEGAEVSEGTVIVTAKLGDGKSWGSLPEGWTRVNTTTATKSITLPKVECELITPVAPTVTDGTCVNGVTGNPTVSLAITSGIVYTFTTAPDAVTGGDFTVQAKLSDGTAWGTMPEGWIAVDETTATFSGSVEAAPCDPVAPVDPTVNQGDCINGGIINPSVTLAPNGDGITYTKSGAEVSEGTVIVTAKLGEGKSWGSLPEGWIKVDETTASKTIALPKVECESTVPTEPTVVEGDCINGGIVNPTVTLAPNGNGITYTKSGGEVPGSIVVVTATLSDGFAWGTMPEGWTQTSLTQATFTVNLEPVDCEETVPAAPVVEEAACVGGDVTTPSVTLQTTNGISYQKEGAEVPGGEVTVTATIVKGYEWGSMPEGWTRVNATTATYTVNLLNVECEEVQPAEPTVYEGACVGGEVINPSVTLTETDGITYSKEGAEISEGSVVVTAKLSDGYGWPAVLPEGWTKVDDATATKTITLPKVECESVSPIAPEVFEASCLSGVVNNPMVTLAETTGITYSKAGAEVSGGSVIVTATVQDGYGWPETLPVGWTKVDNATATFTVDLLDVECVVVEPVAPVVEEAACITGVVTVPSVTLGETEGITYTKEGDEVPGGVVVVTAIVQDGFGWPETLPDGWTKVDDATATFTVELLDVECLQVTPVDPKVDDSSCLDGTTVPPTITLPTTPGVIYTQDGDVTPGGTVIVTATVEDGYGWPETLPDGWTRVDDATATFTVTFGKVSCELPETPTTPESPTTPTTPVTALPVTGAGSAGGSTSAMPLSMMLMALATLLALAGYGIRERGRI